MNRSGNARTFLLVALGAAVAVMVVGGIWMVRSGPGGPSETGDEDGPEPLVPRPGGTDRPARDRSARASRQDPGEAGEEDEDGLFVGPTEITGGRNPEGEVYVIDAASLRRCLEAREFEELRRQIDELQAEGGTIPEDLVRDLIALLADPRYGIDAQLALGQVKDAFTGNALADLAGDPNAAEAVRLAALKALAQNGAGEALGRVLDLVSAQAGDGPYFRNGVLALAGIGGPEGVGALLDLLAAHPGDDRTDVLVTALVKARDADSSLAQVLREARAAADVDRMNLLLRVGTGIGAGAGPEMRREVLAIAQSAAVLDALDLEPHQREQLRFSAVCVAGAMGGEALDVVIGLVRSEGGTLRNCALAALSGARGDDAAEKLSALLDPSLDETARRAVVSALGATGSRKATSTLLRALDDPHGGVRETAAAGLARLGDADAVPEILRRLDGAKGDRVVAMNLVRALGESKVRDALPKLGALLASEDPFWTDLRLWIRDAIKKIEK